MDLCKGQRVSRFIIIIFIISFCCRQFTCQISKTLAFVCIEHEPPKNEPIERLDTVWYWTAWWWLTLDWRNDSCPDELALITLRKCQNINMLSKGIMQIAAQTWTCAKYNKVANRADEVFRTDLQTSTCPAHPLTIGLRWFLFIKMNFLMRKYT